MNRLSLIAFATITALSGSLSAQQVETPVCLECQQELTAASTQSTSAVSGAVSGTNLGVLLGPRAPLTEPTAEPTAEPTVESTSEPGQALALLPLLLLPLLGFLLWTMVSKQKEQPAVCEADHNNVSQQQPSSHHSLSKGFVSASKVKREASNKCSAEPVIAINNARVEGHQSKPDFKNLDVTDDPTRSPVDFLYESELELKIVEAQQRNLGISALYEMQVDSRSAPVNFDFESVSFLSGADHSKTTTETTTETANVLNNSVTNSSLNQASSETTGAVATVAKTDDLTKIRGLGKASQKVLNDNRVHSFTQVASMSSEQLDELFSETRRFQLINTSTWPDQARELVGAASNQEADELDAELRLIVEINSMREIATQATSPSKPAKKAQASHR